MTKGHSDLESTSNRKAGSKPRGRNSTSDGNLNTPMRRESRVLDDFLDWILTAQRDFGVTRSNVRLRDLDLTAETRTLLATIHRLTIERCEARIYAAEHPFLDSLGADVYGERYSNPVFKLPRRQIEPGRVAEVLNSLLELALQILVRLPSKNPGFISTRNLRLLASSLMKDADKLIAVLGDQRALVQLKDSESSANLVALSSEMRRGAEALDRASRVKVRVTHEANPNPQVRFALYLAGWIETCTGRPHYAVLADLFQAAFIAERKEPPKWISRLEIEMTRKHKYGRKWFRRVSRK